MTEARCRIFLFTYRRSHLLGRALAGLQSQTMPDWVCEVHNDDPRDPEPRRIVEAMGDDRIQLVDHPRNLGAMAAYNLAFSSVPEEYSAMAQDDNWWADDFLETMIGVLDRHPECKVAVSNQWHVHEQKDGSWLDTGKTTRPVRDGVYRVTWPHIFSVVSAWYADGSTVMRSDGLEALKVPEAAPFAMVEALRERLFAFPLLFVARPLMYFAVTLDSARAEGGGDYSACQALLAGAFFRHVSLDPESFEAWLDAQCRGSVPPWNLLILTGLADPACRWLWSHVPARGWVRFTAGAARRPRMIMETLRRMLTDQELRRFLDEATLRQVQALPAPPRTFSQEEALCSE